MQDLGHSFGFLQCLHIIIGRRRPEIAQTLSPSTASTKECIQKSRKSFQEKNCVFLTWPPVAIRGRRRFLFNQRRKRKQLADIGGGKLGMSKRSSENGTDGHLFGFLDAGLEVANAYGKRRLNKSSTLFLHPPPHPSSFLVVLVRFARRKHAENTNFRKHD